MLHETHVTFVFLEDSIFIPANAGDLRCSVWGYYM